MVSSSSADPDRLFEQLAAAAESPPIPPLYIPEPVRSQRRSPVGPLVTGARRAFLRVLSPSLVELVGQLERERLHQREVIAELQGRIARLEQEKSS